MEIKVTLGHTGLWQYELWDGNQLVCFDSMFPSYAKAELNAKARLSALERIAATGG